MPLAWLHSAATPSRLAAGIGLLAIALPAASARSSTMPYAATPRLTAVDYVSKLPPGVAPSDSEKVYLASMNEPRTSTGRIHLHGGAWTPIHKRTANAMIGTRIGLNMGDHVLFGGLTGWTYHSANLYDTAPASGPPGLHPQTVLATASANLIPAMAFLQVTLTKKSLLAPYVGIAAGYEWLYLKAKDYRTDADSSLTYGSPAWEWYAGMGLRLSRSVRVDGEAYFNGAEPGRDVIVNNERLREVVDMNGVGVRVGLSILY